MRSFVAVVLVVVSLLPAFAQQPDSSKTSEAPKSRETKAKPAAQTAPPEAKPELVSAPEAKPEIAKESATEKAADKEEHFDVTEMPPVVTHHQLTLDGKVLKY